MKTRKMTTPKCKYTGVETEDLAEYPQFYNQIKRRAWFRPLICRCDDEPHVSISIGDFIWEHLEVLRDNRIKDPVLQFEIINKMMK